MLGALLIVLGCPALASASTVKLEGTTLVYTAADGETNAVNFTLDQSGGGGPQGIQISDSGAEISSGSPSVCVAGHNSALCNGSGITAIKVTLGDQGDQVSFAPALNLPVVVDGGSGGDGIDGSDKADVLIGGPGDDTINGGGGNDTILAGDGDNKVTGGDGNDTISSGSGTDIISGDDGNDSISAGGGEDDTLSGGTGDDVLDGGAGADSISGGPGTDTVSYAGRTDAINVDLNNQPDDGANNEGDDVQNDIEIVVGGSGDDRLAGSDAADVLIGGPGDDDLIGRDGNDTLQGGEGNDLLDGSGGADDISGGPGEDSVTYGPRTNGVTVTLDDQPNDGEPGENDNVHTDIEDVYGGSGDDTLVGDAARNLMGGQDGNDTIQGMGGDDVLNGGNGGDTISGGDGKDIVNYAWESDPVSVSYDGVANDGAPGENDNIGTDIEGVIGGSADDLLLGGPADDFLYGYGGNDTILGGPGKDMVVGSDGDDHIQTMDGTPDFVSCGDGKDVALVDSKDSVAGDCETRVVGTAVAITTPARGLTAAGGTLAVPLACQPLILDGCTGTLTLTVKLPTAAPAKPKARAAAATKKRKKHKHHKRRKHHKHKPAPKTTGSAVQTIGTATFTLAPGSEAKISVTLTPQGQAMLRQQKKLGVTASAANTDPAGGVSTAKQTFFVRAGR